MCCFSGADVIRAVRKLGSAVVICGFKLRDMTAGDLAASLRGSAALLVVTSPVYLDMCGGDNLYKLPTPVARADFFSSLRMIRELEERTGHKVIGNKSASGTEIIEELGQSIEFWNIS